MNSVALEFWAKHKALIMALANTLTTSEGVQHES
jgi:hypothetical protein